MSHSSFKCPACVFTHDSLNSLRIHAQKKHQISALDLYLSCVLNGERPRCVCGCGSETKFIGLMKGFSEYKLGHASRVNNNWGRNADAKKKSQNVRHEMHKRGEIKIWNKGETKESDERIAAYGRVGSETLKRECVQQRSEHMKSQWKTNNLSAKFGNEHPNWAGGTSKLQQLSRSRVFNVWSRPKVIAAGCVCQSCKAEDGRGVVVHHDQERFATILRKAIKIFGEVDESQPNEDFERKSSIADWVAAYHIQNNVSGIVLCEPCHIKAHAAFGAKDQLPMV